MCSKCLHDFALFVKILYEVYMVQYAVWSYVLDIHVTAFFGVLAPSIHQGKLLTSGGGIGEYFFNGKLLVQNTDIYWYSLESI